MNEKRLSKVKVRIVVAAVLLLFAVFAGTGFVVNAAAKSKTVTNKKDLVAMLKGNSSGTVTFKTKDKLTISIPVIKGCKDKTLIIDAPDATITNASVFKGITIKNAKSYTEKQSGNTINLKSKNTVFTVYKKKTVAKLTVASSKADIKLGKNAKITTLIFNKSGLNGTVKFENGAKTAIELNKKTALTLTGKNKKAVSVTVNAKGSSITSSVPINVNANKDVKITFNKGSEGSLVEAPSDKVKLTITDNSSKKADVKIAGIYAPDPVPDFTEIDQKNFPDEIFRSFVSENFDLDRDGKLSAKEIKVVTFVGAGDLGISDLKGIEYFVYATEIQCQGNSLQTLDVSRNVKLKRLDCGINQLKNLDLSRNLLLEELLCGINEELNSFDVSKNEKLKLLVCDGNNIAGIDVSSNKALEKLCIQYNKLTSLDVSNNTALKYLQCDHNESLGELDVTKNTMLRELICDSDGLTKIDVSQNEALERLNIQYNMLTTIDLSSNTDLKYLVCYNNEINKLDVSKCIFMEEILCWDNKLTDIDLSNNSLLRYFDCQGNPFTKLDLKNNYALEDLRCGYCELKELDVTANEKLIILWCAENKIQKLDLSHNPELKELICGGNGIRTLDLRNNKKLGIVEKNDEVSVIRNIEISEDVFPDPVFRDYIKYADKDNDGIISDSERRAQIDIKVSGTAVTSLQGIEIFEKFGDIDISNTEIKSLYVSGKPVNSIKADNTGSLEELFCSNCGLKNFSISNSGVQILYCDGNNLSSLDTPSLPGLRRLCCSCNPFGKLDLSKNTELEFINCGACELSELDLSNNKNLDSLECRNNNISELDLSQNSILNFVDADDNTVIKR